MFDAYDLFQSIDVIVDSRLAALKLDRTLVCKISHDANKMYGQYEVTYNATRFTASSEKTDYAIGDTVYVGVPENNFSNAYIISKKILDASVHNNADPFEDFIIMTEYTVPDKISIVSGLIVSEDKLTTPLLSQDITDIESYANLGLSFQVSSTLPEDYKYGFIIQVITQEKLNEEGATYPKNHLFTFSCDEMIGKSNMFLGEFVQKKLVDIAKLTNISKVNVYLDVDQGATALSEDSYLYFKNLSISFGYLKTNYNENSVYVYTNGSQNYIYEDDKPIPKRDIYIRWLHTDGLGRLTAFTEKNADKLPDNVVVKWYLLEAGDWKDLNNDGQLSYSLLPNKYRANEQIKCIISHEVFGKDIPIDEESNILILTNKTPGYGDVIEGKSFTVSTAQQDFSGYYNIDGSIVDFSVADTVRAVTAAFSVADKVWSDDVISIIAKWTIPSVDTMLAIPETDKQYFTKTGASYVKTETIDISAETLELTRGKVTKTCNYQINDYYAPNCRNNTITCDIQVIQNSTKEVLQSDNGSISLDFKRPGVCEKDSVLMLSMFDEEGAKVRCIKPEQKITIVAELYDNNGVEVPIVTPVAWSWYSPTETENDFLSFESTGNDTCVITAKTSIPTNADSNYSGYAYILQGSYVTEGSLGKREVVGLLPIAINLSSSIKYLSGPVQIVYSSSGGNPTYYKNSYKMYLQSGNPMRNMTYEVHSPGTYDYPSGKNNPIYPIIGTIDDEAWLCPKSTYIKDADKNCAIVTRSNGLLYWIQPLLLYQTNSFSSFVNEWDGKMKIDEENNVAMMARLGAGKKNEDGSYSGVLLGDWVPEIEDGSWNGTGIFGYDHGKASYGFREDGTAFIGKSGSGRINFNGNEGLIYSDNFNGTVYGIQEIDLLQDIQWLTRDDLGFGGTGSTSVTPGFDNLENASLSLITLKQDDGSLIQLKQPGDSVGLDWKIQNTGANVSSWEKTFRPGQTFVFIEEIEITDATRSDKDGAYTQKMKPDEKDSLSYLQIDVSSYKYTNHQVVETIVIDDDGEETVSQTTTSDEILYDLMWAEDSISYDVVKTGARIRIKKRITIPGIEETIEEAEDKKSKTITRNYIKALELPLFNAQLIAGANNLTGDAVGTAIGFRYEISNIKLYHIPVLDTEAAIQSNGAIDYDRLLIFDQGTQGSFINLSEGDLVTNNGVFRGTVQAENLEVLKEVTIGDLASGNYITLGPKGVDIAPTVIVRAVSGGGGTGDVSNLTNLTVPGVLDLGIEGSLGSRMIEAVKLAAGEVNDGKWAFADTIRTHLLSVTKSDTDNTTMLLVNGLNEYPVSITKAKIHELKVDNFDYSGLNVSDQISAIKNFHFYTYASDHLDNEYGVYVANGDEATMYGEKYVFKGEVGIEDALWSQRMISAHAGFNCASSLYEPMILQWSYDSTRSLSNPGTRDERKLTLTTYAVDPSTHEVLGKLSSYTLLPDA